MILHNKVLWCSKKSQIFLWCSTVWGYGLGVQLECDRQEMHGLFYGETSKVEI